MVEHTIRNKTTNPIVTLRPKTLQAMLAARPESSSLTLARFTALYRSLTNKSITLDYDQQQLLLERYDADSQGMWVSRFSKLPYDLLKVVGLFKDGFFRDPNMEGFLHDLTVAEVFYDMLEKHANLTPGVSTNRPSSK